MDSRHFVGVILEFKNQIGESQIITLISSPCKIRALISEKIESMKVSGFSQLARISYTNTSFGRPL